MKYALLLAFAATSMFTASAQEKKPVASPPATATQTIASGATITINYGQPSVKGRTIGKDLEPMDGKVWRAGANNATTFETTKDITVEGQALPKGKYSLFTLQNGAEWTVIFNKTHNQWGAYEYKEAEDALRVKAKAGKGSFAEKLTFTIAKDGTVSIMWGDHKVDFSVK
ncbi:MAG: DUF2911 domain-containing protein [Chitinophagaceae bacterium]|nr:MAG: DUF2911 domain-containing protein [Chitinophagaceae bacterium]